MSELTSLSGHYGLPLARAGLLALCILLASPTGAAADGDFVIHDAYANEKDGVYYLGATIDYRLNDTALEALNRGVALTFELNIVVNRVQRWRPDKTVAELLQLYELQYHALSERFVVRNLNSGDQQSFLTLNAALVYLGDIRDLPFLDRALLNPKRSYLIQIRSVLDIRSLPGPLRVLAVFFGDWRLASDWYRWQLL